MGWIIGGIVVGIILVIVNFAFPAFYNNEFANEISRGTKTKREVRKSLVLVGFLAPIVLFTLLASFTKVGTGEIAVMTRFGRVTGQELGEGIHFKNPLDKANAYDIKVLKKEADAAAASKDLQDVRAHVVINYNLEVGKISEIHRTVGMRYEEKLIDPSIQEVVKASTAKFDATQLITERERVKNEAYEALKLRLEPYGIVVRDLAITNMDFSPEFTKAIESKQIAQQEAQRAIFIAERAKQEAQAEIERAKGQAESQRLLTETASEQSLELRKLEVQRAAIEKWNGQLPTTQLGEGSQFILPLPQN